VKEVDASDCLVHVNVCTNERTDGRSCCRKVGGQEFFELLKGRVKEAGLRGTHWVTRTGCLGYCNDVGTTVAIHAHGKRSIWLTEVGLGDSDEVWRLMLEAASR